MLHEEGDEIFCSYNLYTGSKSNIQTFLDSNNFNFIEADIREGLEFNVDQIYNSKGFKRRYY